MSDPLTAAMNLALLAGVLGLAAVGVLALAYALTTAILRWLDRRP